MGWNQGSLSGFRILGVENRREKGGRARGGFREVCLGSGVREAAVAGVCSSQGDPSLELGQRMGTPQGGSGKESVGAEPVARKGTGWASLVVSRGAQGKPPGARGADLKIFLKLVVKYK